MSKHESRITPLSPDQLYTSCDAGALGFETTDALEPLDHFVGQDRAVEAVKFSIGMRRDGYNLFAFGPEGTGKASLVQSFLDVSSAAEPVPDDWAYVNNFAEPHKPRALRLPTGRARPLAADMERLIEDLGAAIPAAFESDDYRNRRQHIEETLKKNQESSMAALNTEAEEKGVAIIRTQVGLAVAPVKDGEILEPDAFKKLPEDEQESLNEAIKGIQDKLQEALSHMPEWQKQHHDLLRDLGRDVTEKVVAHQFSDLTPKYQDLPEVLAYLKIVHQEIVHHARDFLPQETGDAGARPQGLDEDLDALKRYAVNVVVDNGPLLPGDDDDGADGAVDAAGAPVITEAHPIMARLLGRIEHRSHMGALLTDFTMIKPGALHAANGGYLVLDARKLLTQPYAWDALKRALTSKTIRIEGPGEMIGFQSTISLEPEPIPLNAKIVLLGEPDLYYMLSRHDPEFRKLFKVAADFDTVMARSPETAMHYARLAANLSADEGVRPLDAPAVARTVEYGARLADDAERLSTHMGSVADLIREADYFAAEGDAKIIGAAHIQTALDAKIYRSDRTRERMQEQIERDTIVIDTEGEAVGEVNGLAVYQLDHFSFGKPSRISARVHPGRGQIVDIEREVALGGPLHTKGVLILSSYLASKYSRDAPLALAANLVFEQSYGGVDGDSASSTELYVLVSAIAEVPLKQSIAVTGSVDQQGRVQAIGGANEKIEGFFDICAARGLTGEQGVMIPKANVKHLMLKSDVVDACRDGQFHIYAVATIDEGLEVLTGLEAGEADEKGYYPIGSLNRTVTAKLEASAKKALALARPIANGGNGTRKR
ncbi:MAG: AAA family ATPase [Rhodospirillaceae bacterium]|jgi:predicted ATP-dependent protease|nr:AAA family ATPase [Rhodospirillaceae bacterium]MBT3886428.1 AAA family ATPase [Rhodospirillaceae bacterium]MBT4115674.1 AAA family ATPase [Rhodospirillaceae bacterium]MBT4672357.1 AAA family ATPase [Rhodospirillaceae bacterium]MBT4719193.1 AAA family ATPase [Rhodospirillaceae bacterium]